MGAVPPEDPQDSATVAPPAWGASAAPEDAEGPPPPAQAPARAPGPPASEGAASALARFLKENLEAIAVAVVMALVIKHFCVEAFKIPTYSMEPTLLGEGKHGESEGDRILVDKWAYLFSSPRRWDVIVFRYPLNQARNFIKRIAGLPGEELRISDDGDVWVRPVPPEDAQPEPFRIARKPRRVREQLYTPVYPDPALLEPSPPSEDGDQDEPEGPEVYWRAAPDGRPSAWRLESHVRFAFAGGEAAAMENRRKIRNHDKDFGGYTHPYRWDEDGSEPVRDVRVRFRVRPENGTDAAPGRLSVSWRPDQDYFVAVVLDTRANASRAFVRRQETVVSERVLPRGLEPGRALDVEVEYVDGDLRVWLAGLEVAVLPDGRGIGETDPFSHGESSQRLSFEAEGLPLAVEEVRIDRDVEHTNDWALGHPGRAEGVAIPTDSYFMLGDNTGKSSDSRKWQMATIHLRDGSVIRHDRDPGNDDSSRVRYSTPSGETRTVGRVVDADGVSRRWYRDEEVGAPEQEVHPFVPRDLIVGRAFFIFWPWAPRFPGRIGLIH
jgi:signal peptidase I